jgi:hypothetical protein
MGYFFNDNSQWADTQDVVFLASASYFGTNTGTKETDRGTVAVELTTTAWAGSTGMTGSVWTRKDSTWDWRSVGTVTPPLSASNQTVRNTFAGCDREVQFRLVGQTNVTASVVVTGEFR